MPSDYERLAQEDILSSRVGSETALRPIIYYGEGPFDPPSSDSEEDETLLEKPNVGPSQVEEGQHNSNSPRKRQSSVRYLVITLVSLISLSAIIGIFAARSYVGTVYRINGVRKITMDHVFNGTFGAERRSLSWVPEAGDGVFSISEDGYIKLVDLKTGNATNLLDTEDVKNSQGRRIKIDSWQLSSDMKYLLIKTDHQKQWRWSSFGNYYIHDIKAKTTHPLITPSYPPKTAYATWSPTGQSIAYVMNNDLYILSSPADDAIPIRLTNTNSTTIFNGVPSWVYEEEVFSADYSLWWSPDSSKLAFCTFDETDVEEYTFPIYNPTNHNNEVFPYTAEVKMRYPKPGYKNPIVGVWVFDFSSYQSKQTGGIPVPDELFELNWEGRHREDNSIVSEVVWVGNSTLILKEINRNADDGNVVLFDLGADEITSSSRSQGKVSRKLGKNGEQGDDGWVDPEQYIYSIPSSILRALSLVDDSPSVAYLDIVPTPEGYNHIALFNPANSSTPIFLTSGQWEVTGGIQGVDSNGTIYYQAANPLSTARHLYSVSLSSVSAKTLPESTILSDISEPVSFYSSHFSPEAGFYLLSYEGPSIPWQKVIQTNNADFDYDLTTNERLANATAEYEAATVVYSTIDSDGYELNVKEIRPSRMDDSGRTKYPVLFRVYGGPSSQMVDLRFSRDWHDYLACGLQYIIVTVDGRGTGFKGRRLRNTVKGNLGYFETIDQINAARIWASKDYVDPKRIGIWGWSYGGFMSSKVVEADAGIHSLAMAVAPVTSWRLYDSIYTERYMNLPLVNPMGYINASISNVTGFQHADFLLAHGSGDDNVHYANSAHLLDMFTGAQVRNFRFRMFTDSDHSISRRGAYREVFEFLTEFLVEKWGKGARRRGW